MPRRLQGLVDEAASLPTNGLPARRPLRCRVARPTGMIRSAGGSPCRRRRPVAPPPEITFLHVLASSRSAESLGAKPVGVLLNRPSRHRVTVRARQRECSLQEGHCATDAPPRFRTNWLWLPVVRAAVSPANPALARLPSRTPRGRPSRPWLDSTSGVSPPSRRRCGVACEGDEQLA